MSKTVLDMCPFMGLKYEEDDVEHVKGEGLTREENKRLDSYFAKFFRQAFQREKSIELAQMALNNEPIPEGWEPKGE